MPSAWIFASLLKSVYVTLEITLIILGALLLLYVMKSAGALKSIDNYLCKLSGDRRIQAILLGWFFISFIEGVSGFGAPAAIVAPLLVAIGFPALSAVMIALMGNSTSVTFGAVGTPILIGMSEGLGSFFADTSSVLDSVIFTTSLIHLCVGTLVPLAMSVMLTGFFGGGIKKGLAIWPYALTAGLAFTVPYFLIAIFVGAEFPSILGSVIGGTIMVFLTRRGVFLPKENWDFPEKFKNDAVLAPTSTTDSPPVVIWRALLPYVLVMTLLLAGKIGSGLLKELLGSLVLSSPSVLATGISYNFKVFSSPGFVFLAVAIFSAFYYRIGFVRGKEAILLSLKRVYRPALSLIAVIAIVQIIINSYANNLGLPSASVYLASLAVSLHGGWILIAPFVGLFGAFVAGSSTVSNLLFSLFQAETAVGAGLSPILILALQNVGSAVGNMISVHNVLAVLATVGLIGMEGKIISRNLIPAFSYAGLAGIGVLIFVLVS
jgi:lactate permease